MCGSQPVYLVTAFCPLSALQWSTLFLIFGAFDQIAEFFMLQFSLRIYIHFFDASGRHRGFLGLILSAAVIAWATFTATRLFDARIKLSHQVFSRVQSLFVRSLLLVVFLDNL